MKDPFTNFKVTAERNGVSAETIVTLHQTNCLFFHYEEIVKTARKNLASREVHFESFGNDSAYLDRLDEVGDEFVITDVSVDSPNKVRYHIYGHYSSDDGGTWSDHVFAANDEHADFEARFQMAVNEGARPDSDSDFALTMEEIDIYDCYREPVTKDEAIGFIRKLSEMQPWDESSSTLISEASKVLQGDHYEA